MREYCKETTAIHNEEPPPQENPAHPGVQRTPSYRSLAAQYGVKLKKKVGKQPSDNKQIVKQEYQAYVTAPLPSVDVNHLKFWEVGGDM